MTDLNDKNEEELAPEGRDSIKDPLLVCLSILCGKEKHAFSPQAILSNLPLKNGRLTPTLFTRAAKWLGFRSKIVKRKIEDISELILPVVLVLNDDEACVLEKFTDEGQVEVIFPHQPNDVTTMDIAALNESYTGYAIFVQATQQFDERAKQYHGDKKGSWFWGTVFQFKGIYSQVLLAALLVNVFTLATPLFIMNVYDRVIPNQATDTLWVLAIGILIVFVFDFLLRILRGYLIDVAGQKTDVLLGSQLFQHVLGMKLAGRPISAGAFASNFREFDSIREFFTSATLTAVVDLPFLFLFIGVIALVGGWLALIPLVAAPLVIIATILLEKPMSRAVEEAKIGSAQKHAILTESVSELEMIKSLSAEGNVQGKWERYVEMVSKAALKSRFFSALASNLTVYIQQMATVAIIISGVYLVGSGSLTTGALIAAVILSGRALAPLAQITNILTRFEQSREALSSLNRIIEMPIERPEDSQFLHRADIRGDIEFKDVTFSYPDQPVPALDNVSFKFKAGERVGIIGRFGSGKSTVERLIMGLYPPASGRIFIDGADIAQIDPADLRYHIGYAAQDSTLIYGSVRENMVMGREGVDDARVLEIAKLTGADQFISRHPAGYDMQVGEGGSSLSNGQRQAVNLARALITKTSIILLDEPASSMDRKSEQYFAENLKHYITNETLIVATHKPSLLGLVDRLIVLDEGRLIADGPKDEILARLRPSSYKDQPDHSGEGKHE